VAPEQLITCPHCGKRFPLTDARAEELAGHLLAGKEASLREQLSKELHAQHAASADLMTAQLREQEERLKRDSEELKKLRNTEVELRRERRNLEDARDALQAEKERMRDEIRKQERTSAERQAKERYDADLRQKTEAHETAVRELEDKLRRVNTQLDEAKRKGTTGSRQEEGYTKQDLFAEALRRRFPADEIRVTPRGMAGADVVQMVRASGRDCGIILWECKRAAAWNGTWIGKLADDLAETRADLGVIVSEALPTGVENSGRVDGIWVTDFLHAATLAAGLREAIIMAWRHQLANAGRDDTASKVYDYIAIGGFAERYASAERALDDQLQTLRKEKRYYEQAWSRREQQIDKARASLSGMISDLIRVGAELPSGAFARLPTTDLAALTQAQAPALPSVSGGPA
jgi:hypothetical protein